MNRLFRMAVIACLAAAPAAAFDLSNMTDAERETLRAEIRAYLLDNPEVLMEAIGVLEERQAQQQANADLALVADNAEALFSDGHSWVGGNPDGDVTLVEFIDYRCGFCRRAHPEVAELVSSDGNIRLVVKEFPILGEDSMRSSRFALAVRALAGDAKYKEAADRLIALRANATFESLGTLAGDLGLDKDEVFAAMQSEEVDEVIAKNRALAQAMNINGTPTFVLGSQMLRGYVPLEEMRRITESERDKS